MSADKRARLRQWLESGEARLQPLTFPQRELWESTPVPPGDPANHICCLIFVKGRLTAEDCADVMRRVVERQEVLRLSILPGKDGPLQLIRKELEPAFEYVELSESEATPEAIEARALTVFRKPFDLLQGPLYRVQVLRCAPDDQVFVFAIHHAIADGWTLGVLIQDLAGAYVQAKTGGKHEPLPAVPMAYTAWGAAERTLWPQAELDKRAAFWVKQLSGAPRIWDAHPGADSLEPLRRWTTEVPAALLTGIRQVAREARATLFSTLLAAFRVAFARWNGVTDLTVGSPVANRSSVHARETMGSFASIVPLRAELSEEQPFEVFLQEMHESVQEAFGQVMPFVELAKALGDRPSPGHHPVFEVRFALQNHPVPDVTFSSLSAKLRMRSTGTARFHLGCEITEHDEVLEVVWLSRPALLAEEDVQKLNLLFERVLSSVTRLPEPAFPTS